MSNRLERFATILVAVSASVVALAVVRQSLVASPPDRTASAGVTASEWAEIIQRGHYFGRPDARVKIAVFSDAQCPFCQQFHGTLSKFIAANPTEAAMVFVNFPLDNHRMARPAALAIECAAEQGRASAFVDEIFSLAGAANGKDSAALDWSLEVERARLPNASIFSLCLVRPETAERVTQSVALGNQLRVTATPAVFIGARRYSGALSETELRLAVTQSSESGLLPRLLRSLGETLGPRRD